MKPDRKINISIRIANQPRLRLTIPAADEEIVRRAEENINALWNSWSAKPDFSDKSPSEILAMVTFRFAELYYRNLEASQTIDKVLAGLESSFDDLLSDTAVGDPDSATDTL